jgi:hypothetical protein
MSEWFGRLRQLKSIARKVEDVGDKLVPNARPRKSGQAQKKVPFL